MNFTFGKYRLPSSSRSPLLLFLFFSLARQRLADDERARYECVQCRSRLLGDRMMVVLDRLVREDRGRMFAVPVSDRFAPGYSEIIKTPRCFADVRARLEALAYADVQGDGGAAAFKDDLNLIWRNAKVAIRCFYQLISNL